MKGFSVLLCVGLGLLNAVDTSAQGASPEYVGEQTYDLSDFAHADSLSQVLGPAPGAWLTGKPGFGAPLGLRLRTSAPAQVAVRFDGISLATPLSPAVPLTMIPAQVVGSVSTRPGHRSPDAANGRTAQVELRSREVREMEVHAAAALGTQRYRRAMAAVSNGNADSRQLLALNYVGGARDWFGRRFVGAGEESEQDERLSYDTLMLLAEDVRSLGDWELTSLGSVAWWSEELGSFALLEAQADQVSVVAAVRAERSNLEDSPWTLRVQGRGGYERRRFQATGAETAFEAVGVDDRTRSPFVELLVEPGWDFGGGERVAIGAVVSHSSLVQSRQSTEPIVTDDGQIFTPGPGDRDRDVGSATNAALYADFQASGFDSRLRTRLSGRAERPTESEWGNVEGGRVHGAADLGVFATLVRTNTTTLRFDVHGRLANRRPHYLDGVSRSLGWTNAPLVASERSVDGGPVLTVTGSAYQLDLSFSGLHHLWTNEPSTTHIESPFPRSDIAVYGYEAAVAFNSRHFAARGGLVDPWSEFASGNDFAFPAEVPSHGYITFDGGRQWWRIGTAFRRTSGLERDAANDLGVWARVEVPVDWAPTLRVDVHNLLDQRQECGEFSLRVDGECGPSYDADRNIIGPRAVTVTFQVQGP